MIEILLTWCSLLLVTLCLLAFRILRRLNNVHVHTHITLIHRRDDDDDNDPREAWRNN